MIILITGGSSGLGHGGKQSLPWRKDRFLRLYRVLFVEVFPRGSDGNAPLRARPGNIAYHLVCPGEFDSSMVKELNTYRTAENRVVAQTAPVLSLERIADETVSGIVRGRYLIIPGRIARFLDRINRLFPSIGRTVVDRRIQKAYRGLDH